MKLTLEPGSSLKIASPTAAASYISARATASGHIVVGGIGHYIILNGRDYPVADVAQKVASYEDLLKERDNLQKDLDKVIEQREDSFNRERALIGKQISMMHEANVLKAQLDKANKDVASLKRILEQSDKDYTQLKQDLAELRPQINAMAALLKQTTAERNGARMATSVLQSDVSAARAAANKFKLDRDDAVRQRENFAGLAAERAAVIVRLEKEKEVLQRALNTACVDLVQSRGDVAFRDKAGEEDEPADMLIAAVGGFIARGDARGGNY